MCEGGSQRRRHRTSVGSKRDRGKEMVHAVIETGRMAAAEAR